MKKTVVTNFALLAAIGLLLAGCGSGGGGGDNESAGEGSSTTLAGVVADGYLVGAKVCLDKNNNKKCDADEPYTTTTAGGVYTLPSVPNTDAEKHLVVVEVSTAVTDETRGAVQKPYTMVAPLNKHGFISPFTTLIQYRLENDQSKTTDEHVAELRSELGLETDLFADYYPSSNEATDVQKQAANIAEKLADALADAFETGNDYNAAIEYVSNNLASIINAQDENAEPQPEPEPEPPVVVPEPEPEPPVVVPEPEPVPPVVVPEPEPVPPVVVPEPEPEPPVVVPEPEPEVFFNVTPSAGAGGSIYPAATQTINQGTSTIFTITPNSGYEIVSVNGCGGTLYGNTYTTGSITSNCTVTASFKKSTGSAQFEW
ncbi:MAG: hypothetical protein RBQ99_09115 [Trichlorobacter sp.]|jgi:hypothetical protein|nr:hypothetical protein [Trichlorobacter sp.]